MSWSAKFREPVPLPKSGKLINLDQARAYILKLPAKEAKEKHWQTAIETLLHAANYGGAAWVEFARIAMMQALYPEGEKRAYRMARERPWMKAKKVYLK